MEDMRRRPSQEQAFTLLELLITLAVVSILATLLATAIHKAADRAKATECMSNLKQHGVALHSFVQDHSVYPLVINPGFKLGIEPDHYSSLWAALTNYGLPPVVDRPPSVHDCPAAAVQKSPATNGSRR